MPGELDGHRLSQPLLTRIGGQVRRRRRARSMTVQQLADAAGLSRRMVTQVELGQANPSLATVDRLASALGVEFGALAQDPQSGATQVVPRRQDVSSWTSETGGTLEFRVATSLRPSAELWEGTLPPDAQLRTLGGPQGSEVLIYVVDGVLTIELPPAAPIPVQATESVRTSGDRPHIYANPSSTTTHFVRIFQLGDPGGI